MVEQEMDRQIRAPLKRVLLQLVELKRQISRFAGLSTFKLSPMVRKYYRSSGGTQSRTAAPLHRKESTEVVQASDQAAFLWRFFRHVQLTTGPRENPEVVSSLVWECLEVPKTELDSDLCPSQPHQGKQQKIDIYRHFCVSSLLYKTLFSYFLLWQKPKITVVQTESKISASFRFMSGLCWTFSYFLFDDQLRMFIFSPHASSFVFNSSWTLGTICRPELKMSEKAAKVPKKSYETFGKP